MSFFLWLFVLMVSLFCSWRDIRTGMVPVRWLQGALLIVLLWQGGHDILSFLMAFLGGVLGYICFLIPAVYSEQRWMGRGDAWVGAWMGIVLSFPGVLYGIACTGGLATLGLLVLLSTSQKRERRLPLAPFIQAGLLIATLIVY